MSSLPRHPVFLVPGSAVLSLTVLVSLWAFVAAAAASHSQSTVNLIAVDTDPTGNTATSVGPIQGCAEIAPGGSLSVDVVVDAVPADQPMTFFEYRFNYDPGIINVTAVDNAQLLASAGDFQPLDVFADDPPDSDGSLMVSISDFGGPTETGPGVLTRITLSAVGSGISPLVVDGPDLRDDRNEQIAVESIAPARVAVGQTCASAGPAPAPTQVAAAPDGEPGQTPAAEVTPGQEGTVPGGQPGQTPAAEVTPGQEGTVPGGQPGTTPEAQVTPGTEGSPTSTEATATAVAAEGSPTAGTPATGGQVNGGSGDNGDGVPAWIAAPIAVGVLALLLGGFALWRRSRRGAT